MAEEKAPLKLEKPKISSDSDDEEVPTSPLVSTPPTPEVEEDEHCLIKSLGGGLKVVIKNPTATAVFLSDDNNQLMFVL
jgi:hypothetical protein